MTGIGLLPWREAPAARALHVEAQWLSTFLMRLGTRRLGSGRGVSGFGIASNGRCSRHTTKSTPLHRATDTSVRLTSQILRKRSLRKGSSARNA